MPFNRPAILGLSAAALAATAVFAGSHGGHPAVDARKAHMGLNIHNAGVLFRMAQGKLDYDAGAAQAAADNLAALASMNQMSYWPPGTSNEDIEGTRALPAIWAEGSTVMDQVASLRDATVAMQAAAGTLDGLKGAIGALGGACTACHEKYRAPDN